MSAGADVEPPARAATSPVARTVAWRNLHSVIRSPALILPALDLPALLLHGVRGRAVGRRRHCPGFDYYDYNAFQFVFVLLQSAAFGGVFIGFSIGADFDSGFTRRLFLAARRPLGGRSPATASRR